MSVYISVIIVTRRYFRMAFELYNPSTRANEPYIAIDRQGRLRLSSSLRDMLNCRDRSISLYLAYDPVNHRIAIAKPDIVRRVQRMARVSTRTLRSARRQVAGVKVRRFRPFAPVQFRYIQLRAQFRYNRSLRA